ncbi:MULTISPECIES: hypothetical protein [unclassified Sporolactobacillus]|uniref:hypothetical protein n=1 Tax=unclassified Sporolactobacillus TaxID=2628533 RepID=UPI0023678F63|nr:hypothetical protein [Sporolactobacillus sp. CQH2019]MDD9150007.1 hypothetical protein [Sporolactobacillus sp. CQH2019]
MKRRRRLLPLITTIGIGAAVYQLLRPNNRIGQAVRNRMNQMVQQKKLFPDT